jgi:hypothetical protein
MSAQSHVNNTQPLWRPAGSVLGGSTPSGVTPYLVFANTSRVGITIGDTEVLTIQSIPVPADERDVIYLVQAEWNIFASGYVNYFFPLLYEEVNGASISLGQIGANGGSPWVGGACSWSFLKEADADPPIFSQKIEANSADGFPSAYGTVSIWAFPL